MAVNRAYTVTEAETTEDNRRKCDINSEQNDTVYSFDESINMYGNGWYGISLLGALSLATMAMGMDMFGFSVVVGGASCDFHLDLRQTSILLSMSFIGPIVMSYPWGYISDVYGRRRSLLISLWTSFLVSSISAFSSNWTILAVLKFISTSFSSCAQSATYTLLGESCPQRVRDGYMLIMTSVLDFMLAVYIAIAYGILNMEFSFNLVFIFFTPWRLLTLALASFLGLAALGVHFFYESPKFLLNAGKEKEALNVLRGIWNRNGGKLKNYPVKKVYLNEEGNNTSRNVPLWKSLREQVVPLFKMPLLLRSLQLYFLTSILYGTSNAYFVWFPLLAQKFFEGISSNYDGQETGLCSLIISAYNNDTAAGNCSTKMDVNVVWSSLAQGLLFVAILFGLARIAHRKRTMMIIVLFVSCACGLGAVLIPHNLVSFVMFFGQLTNELVIGVIYSYFVDLYPTSHRGMAACLATMIARASSLGGVNLFGAFVMTHCSYTFYVCSALMACKAACPPQPDAGRRCASAAMPSVDDNKLGEVAAAWHYIEGGILVSLLLPPDKPRK